MFSFFALKHRTWVLVTKAVLTSTQDLCFEQKIKKKNTHFFYLKIIIFTSVKYCSKLHGHVCVMDNQWLLSVP